jgi:hypothetical protein
MNTFPEIESHIIPFEQNAMKWRFEDEDEIPYDHHRENIHPLSKEGSSLLSRFILDSRIHSNFPFQKDRFSTIEVITLRPVTHQEEFKDEDKKIKKWMYQLGLAFDTKVYVSYDSDCGFIMPWKMLIKYWRNFYYSISDDITIFDESLNWCLFMFHEHEFYFGTNKLREVIGIGLPITEEPSHTTTHTGL